MKLQLVLWEWLNIIGPASNQSPQHLFDAWNYLATTNIHCQKKEPLNIEMRKDNKSRISPVESNEQVMWWQFLSNASQQYGAENLNDSELEMILPVLSLYPQTTKNSRTPLTFCILHAFIFLFLPRLKQTINYENSIQYDYH